MFHFLSGSCLCPVHWSQVWVHNEDVVGAAPIADAPTTSEWSIILFSTTKVRLILETWQYLFPGNKLHKNCKQNTILIANIKFYLNNIGHFHQTSMTCVMDSERDAYKLLMGHCNIDISPPRMSSLESQLFCTINPLIFCNASNCRIICSNCWLFNEFFFFFRGKSFRMAFSELQSLRAFVSCPFIALSATLTVELWSKLPKLLGMDSPKIISETPDKPNIYLQRIVKPPNIDIIECAESVYAPELKKLLQLRSSYPVTLCYMPLEWCSDAQSLAVELFGEPCITDTLYAIVFSTQDNSITSHVMKELKKKKPSLRLVFCSASLGMGFDSPCITRIIHGKPPRTMIDFVQQLGRAGRSGQSSESVMYYNSSDIAANIPGLSDDIRKYCQTSDCLRLTMLAVFGFKEKAVDLTGCQCCSNCSSQCQCDSCKGAL